MYTEAVQTLAGQAVAKLEAQRRSLASHLVRSALAGMYVGAAIVLIFTIGGSLAATAPGVVRLAMGVCFGGALTIVVFAGSELFTGSNLVLTLGVLSRKAPHLLTNEERNKAPQFTEKKLKQGIWGIWGGIWAGSPQGWPPGAPTDPYVPD